MDQSELPLYETLWAPWRLGYIASTKDQPQPDGCFLCRYAAHAADDEQNLVVVRGERAFVVLNRFPYNNGHLLVAPVAHKGRLDELDERESLDCLRLLSDMIGRISRLMSAEGFNVGLNLGKTAGAGLPGHLHWHLVPRWNGDTNFMPVLAGANVIPQSLEALYGLLTGDLRASRTDGGRT